MPDQVDEILRNGTRISERCARAARRAQAQEVARLVRAMPDLFRRMLRRGGGRPPAGAKPEGRPVPGSGISP